MLPCNFSTIHDACDTSPMRTNADLSGLPGTSGNNFIEVTVPYSLKTFLKTSSLVSSGKPQMKRLSDGSGPPLANLLLALASAAAAAAAALLPTDGDVPPPPKEAAAVAAAKPPVPGMATPSSVIIETRLAAGFPDEELLVESSNCTRAPCIKDCPSPNCFLWINTSCEPLSGAMKPKPRSSYQARTIPVMGPLEDVAAIAAAPCNAGCCVAKAASCSCAACCNCKDIAAKTSLACIPPQLPPESAARGPAGVTRSESA
mmetsp:Transcript_129415/g.374804  ORF Transcript_129415/g.374804 Transcript_129415/m.374804 type:complete len:259 (-) Transcript_129415:24-800(-)